jgi:hypothetical protein
VVGQSHRDCGGRYTLKNSASVDDQVTESIYVVYPVKRTKRHRYFWRRAATDFFRDSKPIARSFGISGRRTPFLNQTFTLKSSTTKVKSAWLYRHPTAGPVALIEWNSKLLTKLEKEEISSPNRKSVVALLDSVGLVPNAPLVTTTISATYPNNNVGKLEWHELDLQIPITESSFIVEESATRLLMAIGLERALLDQANTFLTARLRSGYMARQHLASLLGWISVLAIENERIENLYRNARGRLRLDERSQEVSEALKSIVSGNSNALIAGFTAGGTLIAASTTEITFGIAPTTLGYSGVVAGIVVWLVSKWSR